MVRGSHSYIQRKLTFQKLRYRLTTSCSPIYLRRRRKPALFSLPPTHLRGRLCPAVSRTRGRPTLPAPQPEQDNRPLV